jgi:O-antigen ligase
MTLNNKRIAWFYCFALLICVYLPSFGVYDKASSQYFFISILNSISIIAIPFFFKQIDLKKYFRNPLFLLYSGFILISLLSVISAINVVESFVKIFHLITFFISLSIILLFVFRKIIKVDSILIIVSISLLIDMYYSLMGYAPFLLNNIEYNYDQNNRLVGLYGNRNILATLLCFKIPFVILLAYRNKSRIIKLLAFTTLIMAFFNITLLSSRATYLSIILCLTFLLLTLLLLYKKKLYIKYYLRKTSLFFVPLIAALIMSSYSVDSQDEGAVINRVSTITSSSDVSKNTRLRYYNHAVTHTLKYPFLGGGIGNWKILSVKYDADNIENYIIPYNAHNDFLEAFAETGIVGGLLYLLFFLYIPYCFFKNIKEKLYDKEEFTQSILLFLPFIVYFVDLNLNFPSSRPSNQVVLLLYILLVMLTQLKIDEKN